MFLRQECLRGHPSRSIPFTSRFRGPTNRLAPTGHCVDSTACVHRRPGGGRCDMSLFGVRRHAPLPAEGHLPGFDGATGWLNSPALTVENLRRKVVLVDFWTYTCINWLRTLAYVRAWAERYQARGLVVVGTHTPEFPFEGDVDNVRQAASDLNVWYPIAL